MEIIPIIFSDYIGMKLEINYKKKDWKFISTWSTWNTYKYVKTNHLTPQQAMGQRRNKKKKKFISQNK